MPGVAVVSDTTHYLPADLVAANDVTLVSLYVTWATSSEREGDMVNFDAFYERLRTSSELPKTSQPSVGDFLEAYEPLVAAGREVVSIHLSGGISGTVEAARQAAAQLEPGRVEVVDSETACGGLGLVVLAAAAAARTGADARTVAARAREARETLRTWFVLDTLEYVHRGGRIGRAQALVGGALKVKPILSIEQELVPVERVRTSGRAFDRMVEYLRSRREDGATAWLVQHAQAPDRAQRLLDAGSEIMGCEPAIVSELGPVIGTYSGPGMLATGGLDGRFLRGD